MDEPSGAAAEGPRGDEPAVSPHLAPDPEPAPAPRRRAPIAAGAIAAAAIVVALVWWGIAPRSTPVALVGDKGRVLEPIQAATDLRTGEQVAPFSGFAISVETDPAGALVTVAGVPRGEAPVLANLDCAPGDRIEISAERAGLPVARTATACRADALVKLKVRLHR